MIKLSTLKCISTLFLSFILLLANAKAPSYNNKSKKLVASKLLMDCEPATALTNVELNNVKASLSTSGTIFFKDDVLDAGYEIPKGEGRHSIYAGALWIGALDDGNNLKMAAQTYGVLSTYEGLLEVDDFWPGPLDSNGETTAATCSRYDRFWTITKKEIDDFRLDFEDGKMDSTYSENFDTWAGPFEDVDGDTEYNPKWGDYPKINGDEAVWYVINDNGNVHTSTIIVDTVRNEARSSEPLGLEIQTLVYVFNTYELKNITFLDYTLINKSSENLKKAYLGTWLDPDLGNPYDDFVGCDTLKNLGICYNGDGEDENFTMSNNTTLGYGDNPPFVGIQILNGIRTSSGKKLGMSGFVFYNNDGANPIQGDPQTAPEYYNYLIGKWKDGTSITYGGTGLNEGSTDEVPYMFPSDPSDPEGWSECSENNKADDRRFIMSTGPFDMRPGVAKKMTQSVLWVRPEGAFDNGCPSFESIRNLADEVLLFYNENLSGDDIAPVITLNGSDFFALEVGDNWSPPTASAVDNVDGDVEVSIDVGNLNLNANGGYDIIYTAVDSNGNSAEQIVTVVVGNGVGIYDYAIDAVSMYPNPVIDWVSIHLNKQVADFIQIFNAQGKLVYQTNLNKLNTSTINLSQLESGLYISKIAYQDEVVSLNKFVKQ